MARRLCFEERVRTEEMAGAGQSHGEAAVASGRHPTTIQRELARNGGREAHRAGSTTTTTTTELARNGGRGAYRAGAAQLAADGRAGRPKACKLGVGRHTVRPAAGPALPQTT